MSTSTVPAVRPDDVGVPLDDPEPPPVIDTEVSERMLTWNEGLRWLDQHAPDWRQYRARPKYHYVFHARWFDVRDLKSWIGK